MFGFGKNRVYKQTCAAAFEVYEMMYGAMYQTASGKGSSMAAEIADYMALSSVVGNLGGFENPELDAAFEAMVRKDRTVGLLDVGLLVIQFSIGFPEPPRKISQKLINEYYTLGANRLQIEGRVYGEDFFERWKNDPTQ
ncbi:hypothetical protein OMB55_00019290 [gamma proteobacterium HIMB55]|nr:hypothetical protein OMB55_00019290 [gamma proteobacterium HIMB55]